MAGRGGTFAVSALVFNVSLVALPFGVIESLAAWRNGEIYTYAVTPRSESATREALDRAAGELVPPEGGRTEAWRAMVTREISEGDFHVAHGALLAAPAMLAPAEANRLQTQLPANASDDQMTGAALALLAPDAQQAYEAPLSGGEFLVLGDMRDLAVDAERWVQGQPTDEFMLILSGLSVAPAPIAGARDVAGGASVVKIARRTGKLSKTFTEYLTQALFAAAPPALLKPAIAQALSQTQIGGEEGAVSGAFQNSIEPEAYKRLAADLSEIRAIAKVTGADVAARLLEFANDSGDLRRLRLIALAGGDRAALIAKRGDRFTLLRAAKGNWALSGRAMQALGALIFALIGLPLSTLIVLGKAFKRREEESAPEIEPAVEWPV